MYVYIYILFKENDGEKPQSHRTLNHDAGKSSSIQSADLAPKRPRKMDAVVAEDSNFMTNVNTKTTGRDEFSIFGEHVAFKLRNLNDRRSQSIAQFEISNILFQIEMGIFRHSTHSHISNASPANPDPSTVQNSDSGARASQILPSSHYSAFSPVVLLRPGSLSMPDSGSPTPQVLQIIPQSLHSNSSIAEDMK